MNLVRSLTGARSHWADATGRSLCGRLRSDSTTEPGNRDDLCTRCVLGMRRISWVAERLAHNENATWFKVDFDAPEEDTVTGRRCDAHFTTARGEHFCSVLTENGTHEGPCVELIEGHKPVENLIWQAMNVDMILPASGTVAVHSAGELHSGTHVPQIAERVTFSYNLSDLLRDPAHKLDARLVELDGTDDRVQDFVFATDGALELYDRIVGDIESQQLRGKDVVVLVICRGGRHRSVAFAENIAAHFDVTAIHHHKHLDVVEEADETSTDADRLAEDFHALAASMVRMGIETDEQLLEALRTVIDA